VQNPFARALDKATGQEVRQVEVMQVVEDQNKPRMQYDPSHPDADPQGYVAMPNVNVVEEMADMINSTRTYEANVTAVQAAKSMALKTLELSK
jgi:flagellar basal-body rod protein FlgC